MRTIFNQEQSDEITSIWEAIRSRMNERKVDPESLAQGTRYSLHNIEEGLKGEVVPLTLGFLRDCVRVLRLASGRIKYFEETEDILSYDECVDLLKPKPMMPPHQSNFWEWHE